MKKPVYTVGLDYGTNSVRCLVVNVSDGNELACHVHEYPSGEQGVLLDNSDDKLARQNPVDCHVSTEYAIKGALQESRNLCLIKFNSSYYIEDISISWIIRKGKDEWKKRLKRTRSLYHAASLRRIAQRHEERENDKKPGV